jgi:hypothetical protein
LFIPIFSKSIFSMMVWKSLILNFLVAPYEDAGKRVKTRLSYLQFSVESITFLSIFCVQYERHQKYLVLKLFFGELKSLMEWKYSKCLFYNTANLWCILMLWYRNLFWHNL